MKKLLTLLLLAACASAFADDAKPNRIERGVNKVQKGTERTVKRTGNWAERTADKTEKGVKRTAERTGNWVDRTAKKTESKVKKVLE